MNICYLAADNDREWNTSEWRCAIPWRARRRNGRGAGLVRLANPIDPAANAAINQADVIVIERLMVAGMLDKAQEWRKAGRIVVLDFDDAYNLMTPDNPAFRFWLEGMVKDERGRVHAREITPAQEFAAGVPLVNGVTTPSALLCADWKPTARHMALLPNYLEWERYATVEKREPDGLIVIGWGGSVSHFNSWRASGLPQALKRVCDIAPNVRVQICGADRRIVDLLHQIRDRLIITPWTRAGDWPRTIARFDIGLAPLVGEYDARRSWIKPLEYMACGAPWLASRSPAYTDIARYGALVDNTVDAWANAILQTIDDLPHLRALAHLGREFAEAQRIDAHLDEIEGIYANFAE